MLCFFTNLSQNWSDLSKKPKKPLWCLCFPRFCRDRERVSFFFLLKRDCLNCCWRNPVSLERKCTKTCSSSSVKWGKNPPTNNTKPSTSLAFFQAASLASSVAQSLPSIPVLPQAPLQSRFLRVLQGESFYQLRNGAQLFLLVSRRKKQPESHQLWEREVISEQLHLWDPATYF